MRPPDFWYPTKHPARPSPVATLLRPLGALYGWVTQLRNRQTGPHTSPVRPLVICVGNLNVGGTGKTPTVIALCTYLAEHNLTAHVVTRGYGGRVIGPIQVDPLRHNAADTGDEALLLAAFAPVWVAKNRAAGVQAAQEAGAAIVILDDGFQNPSVRKDISILTVDAAQGFGNQLCLPAGPLREPLSSGLRRADFILSIGSAAAQETFTTVWHPKILSIRTIPVLSGCLSPLETGINWAEQRLFAFAGIGHPEKFFATLRELGVDLVGCVALDDHQPLSLTLLNRLQNEAQRLGAQLVTTEKDQVRLPAQYQGQILTLPVRLRFAEMGPLAAALAPLLEARAE